MNYGQFLYMIPEALLVLALIIVFFADFCLHKSNRKLSVVSKLTTALLVCQLVNVEKNQICTYRNFWTCLRIVWMPGLLAFLITVFIIK